LRALRVSPTIAPAAWLVVLVLLSTALRVALGQRILAPWIMVDELIYSELAKSLGSSGELRIRDEPAGGAYGLVYPLLIAPAYAVFDSVPNAYAAAKGINAFAMSLVAIPVYLLARRVLSPAWSLAAAALALALPSLLYTGTLMTENAFYPVFVLFALALVAYLERPTAARLALLGGAFVLAFLTRAQAAALGPALVTAPLLLRLAGRQLRPYLPLYGLAAVGMALVGVVQLARGHSSLALLGAYEAVREESYTAGEVARWLLYHAAEFSLALGVIPVAAFVVLAARVRRLPLSEQALVAATASLAVWLLLAVAAFASEVPVPPRVMERNLFYLAPLFLLALLLWIRRRPGVPAPAAVAIAGIAALPAFLPFERLIGTAAVADTPGLQLWWRLADAGVAVADLWLPALLASLAATALVAAPRRLASLLPAALAAYFGLVTYLALEGPHGARTASAASLRAGVGESAPDWIDQATDDTVTVLWSGHASPHAVWENEFFNRRVGAVYRVGADPLPGGLPERELDSGVSAAFALADGTVAPGGSVVGRADGVELVRVEGPLRPVVEVSGLYRNDVWSGPRVVYERRPCAGGSLRATVQTDATLVGRPQTVAGFQVRPGETREIVARLEPRGGACRAEFPVSPTATAPDDPRELGARFLAFRFDPG
jgi:hypothetical protein